MWWGTVSIDLLCTSYVTFQWRIQNFPEAAPTPEFGTKTYYFVILFSPKLYKNERIKTNGWHASLVPHPLDPLLHSLSRQILIYWNQTCFCGAKAWYDRKYLIQDLQFLSRYNEKKQLIQKLAIISQWLYPKDAKSSKGESDWSTKSLMETLLEQKIESFLLTFSSSCYLSL